jgi:hypothetical protein
VLVQVVEVRLPSFRYAENELHPNGLENLWSLLKRTLKRTYVSVEPCHLFRYVGEQAFQYDERQRRARRQWTVQVGCSRLHGQRLTYKNLIGKLQMGKQAQNE